MADLQQITQLCADVAKADKSVLLHEDEVFKLVASTDLLALAKQGLENIARLQTKERSALYKRLCELDDALAKERQILIADIRSELPTAYERHYGCKFGDINSQTACRDLTSTSKRE